MKRLFCALLVLILLLSGLTACGSGKTSDEPIGREDTAQTQPEPETEPIPAPEPESERKPEPEPVSAPEAKPVTEPVSAPEAKPVPEPVPAPEAKPALKGQGIYQEILEEYSMAVKAGEEWLDEHWGRTCINYHMVQQSKYYDKEIYYSLYNINKSGVEELLISNGDAIIDIFTQGPDGKVCTVGNQEYGERTHIYVLDDGRLYVDGSSSAFSGECRVFRITEDCGPVVDECYYFDGDGPHDDGDMGEYYYGYTYLTAEEYAKKVEAIERRIVPVHDTLTWKKVTDIEAQPEAVGEAFVLNRKIFVMKDTIPELYTATVYDMNKSKPYMEDWTYGRVLNDTHFKNTLWFTEQTMDGAKMVSFYGESKFTPNTEVRVMFYVQDGASVPLAWSIEITADGKTTEMGVEQFMSNSGDIDRAMCSADASIAVMLIILTGTV